MFLRLFTQSYLFTYVTTEKIRHLISVNSTSSDPQQQLRQMIKVFQQ